MRFRINGVLFKIQDFKNLSENEKSKVIGMLKVARTTMNTLAENGYIEHGQRIEVYNKVLEEVNLKLVEESKIEEVIEL